MTDEPEAFVPEWTLIARTYLMDKQRMKDVVAVIPEFDTLEIVTEFSWMVQSEFAKLPDTPLTRELFEGVADADQDEFSLYEVQVQELFMRTTTMTGDEEELLHLRGALINAMAVAHNYAFVWVRRPYDFTA